MVGDHLAGEVASVDDSWIGVALRSVYEADRLTQVAEPVTLATVQDDPLDPLLFARDIGRSGGAAAAQRCERDG
jgi:hypothetical protein